MLSALPILVSAQVRAEGLKDFAAPWGIDFGFLVSPENIDVGNTAYENTVINEASVATVTAYWKIQIHNEGRDQFDWTLPDTTVAFALENDIDLHGHPLLYADDNFVPDWVLDSPEEEDEAKDILREHIEAVAGRYKGAVTLWHVVNEAFTYTGGIQDSYWYRSLGDQMLDYAFTVAHETDPDAILIYNDYGLAELDDRKYEAVRDKLLQMRSNDVPVDGLGWQLHFKVDDVLAEEFPLELRMQEMSLLGFTNYITELDIEIPSSSQENLEKQRDAYKKITEIFLRIENRGDMQTWDVSDAQSWLGTAAAPLLFDTNYEKKPGYDGVRAAFSGEPTFDIGVSATLSRTGVLTVRGSADDNYINIIESAGTLFVAGHTQEFSRAAISSSETLQLSEWSSFSIDEVERIRVLLYGGDDTLSVFPFEQVADAEGEGDDPLEEIATLADVILEVNGAGGNEVVRIADLTLNDTRLASAAGTADVVIARTIFEGDFRFNGGAAVDTVTIEDSLVQQRATISMSGGGDDLRITDSLFGDVSVFNTGGGDDIVKVSSEANNGIVGNLFSERASFLLGGGDDSLTISDASFGEIGRLFGYGGSDSLQLTNATAEVEFDIRTIEDVVGAEPDDE